MQNTNIFNLTVAVITCNSESFISSCIKSIMRVGISHESIIVVDDGSTDNTPIIMATEFSEIRFLHGTENKGHSNACNRAIIATNTPYIVIVDHDTEMDQKWLEEINKGIVSQPDAAVIIARSVFNDDRSIIHADGGFTHFIGTMTLYNGFTKIQDAPTKIIEIGAAGSTSMLINRSWAINAGLFDESFFIYLNDFEFSLRIRLMGGKLFCVPLAVVYHKGGTLNLSFRGKGAYPRKRAYFIIRNRLITILKLYRMKTILLLLPAMIFYEFMVLSMAISNSVAVEYFRAVFWIISNHKLILTQRSKIQNLRTVEDGTVLSAYDLTFVPGVIDGRMKLLCKGIVDKIFFVYWRVVYRFL